MTTQLSPAVNGKRRVRMILLTLALVAASTVAAPASVGAAPVEAGYRDFSYAASGVSAPTGQKPQSKLWFNDGSWWGALFSTTTGAYDIYELDNATQIWSDTGVIIEPRNSARLDVLFDGTKLYVASAYVSPTASLPAELRRFSYSPTTRTYSLDTGFPAAIIDGGMEAGVIDKDSLGNLWFTYARSNSVYVTHTSGDDTIWSTPFVVPTEGSSGLRFEDQSALVAYDGRIGVMWSNQADNAMYFASHADGDPDSVWDFNPALQLPEYADDHMNLKSIQASNDGRVFAATKTSLNDGDGPLILLLELTQNGSWKRHTVSRVKEDMTRPIVLIDEENAKVYVLMTGPCCNGGVTYYKDAPLSSISFIDGFGTAFIQSSSDPKINNIASTKQALNSTTGLVAIAGDDSTNYYLHGTLSLGPDNTAPATTLTSTPSDPSGPGQAAFEFVSDEGGSTFECQLDADHWFPCTSPLAYSSISFGTHTFEVRGVDAVGNTEQTPASHTWNVVPVASITFTPSADSHVDEALPDNNFGSSPTVVIDGGATSIEGLLQFDLAGVTGAVSSAVLRVLVTNPTSNGPRMYSSDPAWSEGSVTWSSRPAISGAPIVDLSSVENDAWLEIDVLSAVTGDGPLGFTLVPDSSDALKFSSRDGSNPPQLVVTFESYSDMTPPETTIESGPPAITNLTTADFTFSSSEGSSTFECQTDAGGWAGCNSPVQLIALTAASHTFEVRAVDSSGNTDATPAAAAWTIEQISPTVVSNTPVDGDIDIPVASTIRAVFSEAMDPASISSASFTLTPAGGSAVAVSVTYDADTQTATLTPTSVLAPQTAHTADVAGATDIAGNSVVPASWSFTTADAPAVAIFAPVADSHVAESKPTTNFGTATTLVSDGGNSAQTSFLSFDVVNVGATISSAVLRVYLTNGSSNGPEVSLSSNDWLESEVTWNTQPSLLTGTIADAARVSSGAYLEYDVTDAISGPGIYSFSLSSESSDGTKFSSREASSNQPELVINSSDGPDINPPDTVIDSGPGSSTQSHEATFEFQSIDATASFECRLDSAAWVGCVSPTTYTSLVDGDHQFEVRAIDTSGNIDPTPSLWEWTVLDDLTLVFNPIADAYVLERRSTSNFGTRTNLISDGGTNAHVETVMQFDVTGIDVSTVVSAKLRVYVTNSSTNGPELFSSALGWSESSVNWSNRPGLLSGALVDAVVMTARTWYEFDLTGTITADGSYSFTFHSESTDAVKFSSREGSSPPELVLTLS